MASSQDAIPLLVGQGKAFIREKNVLFERLGCYLVYKVTGGGRIVAERSRFCPRGNYLQSELVFIVSLADV